jgi:hypothetical protein
MELYSILFKRTVLLQRVHDGGKMQVLCLLLPVAVGVLPKVNDDVRLPQTQRRSLNLDDYKKRRGLI